jgi:hypothetical protein
MVTIEKINENIDRKRSRQSSNKQDEYVINGWKEPPLQTFVFEIRKE